MEPEYPFEEERDDLESQERVRYSAPYPPRPRIGDTVAEQRLHGHELRPSAQRRRASRDEEGVFTNLARGVARIFALLFLAAGVGLWMVYFGAMYVLGLLGGPGMMPEDITNDLLFGLLSVFISHALLMWSRSDRVA